MYFLGGMTITGIGWAGPQSVWLDFVSTHATGFRWQLYANRKLIGTTDTPGQRRIIGQLPPSDIPYPLTLVRVDEANVLTDYGAQIPAQPWNRYRLRWSASGMDADLHHFDIVAGTAAGELVDEENVVARVPYVGAVEHSYELSEITESGTWQFGIVPRDNALPLGNAGTTSTVDVEAVVMPPDVAMDADGNRFTLTAVGGVLTATIAY